jgi:release factor glutamine methyltransferase
MADVRTETEDPKKKGKVSEQHKGKLVRDEEGQWRLIKEEKGEAIDEKVKAATSLDERVVANIIAKSSVLLAQAGIRTSRLDAELLMLHVLGVSREELVKNWTKRIKEEDYIKFQAFLERRTRREPLAYITGRKEFYGNMFVVDKRVMIPRPETETLVEHAMTFIKKWDRSGDQLSLVDVGTGCGCIAISIALLANFVKIFAVDTSDVSLEVARINAALHSVDGVIGFLHGDLLTPLPHPVHLVIANLPYISDAKFPTLQPEITNYEPRGAFLAGGDGLDLYRRMFEQLPQYLLKGGKVLCEIDPQQHEAVNVMILNALPHATIEFVKDHTGRDRVVVAHT